MRVLIVTVTAGSGHLQAAAALEQWWKEDRPDDSVQTVDLLDFGSLLHKRFHAEGYVKLIEHAPELYALVFKKTDNPELVKKLGEFRQGFARRTNKKFIQYLTEFQPRVVVCTHYLPLEVIGSLKAEGSRIFTVCVVTDFEAHAFWMASSVDLYCVAAPETKSSLVARGAPERSVAVTGIPIAKLFSEPINTRSVRKRYGLRTDLPVLLVLGGGFGLSPVAAILEQLDRVDSLFQTIVVTGRNEELRREIACQDRRHPTDVFGYVSNMHELMAACDLILTKPGGLTTSEALTLGKPIMVLNPIPGQEAANSDFLLERGAATKLNRVEDLPPRLEQLLGSQRLSTLARAARKLGQPHAARNIRDEIIRRLAVDASE